MRQVMHLFLHQTSCHYHLAQMEMFANDPFSPVTTSIPGPDALQVETGRLL